MYLVIFVAITAYIIKHKHRSANPEASEARRARKDEREERRKRKKEQQRRDDEEVPKGAQGRSVEEEVVHYASLASGSLKSEREYVVRYEPRVQKGNIIFGVVGRLRSKKGAGTTKTIAFKFSDDNDFTRQLAEAAISLAVVCGLHA